MAKQNLFNRGYFDEGKGSGYKRPYNLDNALPYLNVIINSVNNTIRPSLVLDIGCAKGYMVYLLDQLSVDAYGVDISSYAVSCAPQEIKNKLHILDVERENLPFPDNYFNLITILEVLEHLNSFEHLIGEMDRILNKDGYVLATTPTPKRRQAKADETHINVQHKKFWVELFKGHGLILVSDDVWRQFRAIFLKEFKKVMPENPPSTKIAAILTKMGRIGSAIRNNIFPYLDYFSLFRSDEILLFKKASGREN